jgi:arginase
MVDPERIALVGVRSLDDGERALIRELGLRCYTMRDIDLRGIHRVMAEALEVVNQDTAGFHLTFDLDGTDPSVAPGVGTPVPGGLTWDEALLRIGALVDSGRRVVGLDLCEVSPGEGEDDGEDTWDAVVGARLLYKMIGAALASRGA